LIRRTSRRPPSDPPASATTDFDARDEHRFETRAESGPSFRSARTEDGYLSIASRGLIRTPLDQRWRIALGLASLVVLLAIYSYLSHRQHAINPKDTTMPSLGQIAEGTAKVFEKQSDGERWVVADVESSMARLFLGLFFGVVGAIILGVLAGCYAPIESLILPPLSLLAKVPPTAALAVFFVLVGTDTEMYVAMIAFGVLPTLAHAVYLSVKAVPDEMVFKAYTLGASNAEVIWNIIVRHALPSIIDTVRLQIGPAMVYLIAAEMVVGDVGFGYRIKIQSRLLNMNVVYPYLCLLASIGFGMDSALKLLQRRLCPWYVNG
jgi:NitT/TauT family transport system permease protein